MTLNDSDSGHAARPVSDIAVNQDLVDNFEDEDLDSKTSISGLFEDSSNDRNSAGTGQGKQDQEDASPEIALKEAKAVCVTKILVAMVLLVSAGLLGFFSYKYTSNQEDQQFQTKFFNFADEIARSGINNAQNSVTLLQTFARTITSLATFANQTWPFLTIPDFEVRARDYQIISHVEDVALAPIVYDKFREAWEQYTDQNQAWIQRGLDYEYLANLVDSDKQLETQQTPTSIAPGTNMEGFSIINKARPIQPFIWENAPLTNKAIPDRGKGPHCPIWQTFPAPKNAYVVNRDIRHVYQFSHLLDMTANNATTVLSGIVDNFALFGSSQTIDIDPKSIMVQPVMSNIHIDADTTVSAFLVVIKKWEIYFQDVLYQGAEPVVVVLHNSCGQVFTYLILGPKANFLGLGDLHDPDYDDTLTVAHFTLPHVAQECQFSIYVYPTKEMEAANKTNMPIYVMIVVLAVFGFTSLVFLLYDFFVAKRQTKTLQSANATHRIVANLFPAAVRERMIQEMEAQDIREAENLEAEGDSIAGLTRHSRHTRAKPRNKADSAFANLGLNGSNHSRGSGKGGKGPGFVGTSETIFGSKPIAELFPETTIMFADMVGFTAWSSVREPTQVFMLLETIYHAFDTTAKRRRVFKVETIGDCYVAVTGLPMPRKDHAIVMARFSSECLAQMDILTRNLEASLGPDTGDLSLRVGLHSGAVTAGVLRGEKGRFQLFGDTVNTASRMESTGAKGKIQVSRETATLLKTAGKEGWIIQRADKVHAKGKGELQTWWLQIKSGSDQDACSLPGSNGFDSKPPEAAPRLPREASSRFGSPDGDKNNEVKGMMIAYAKSKRLIDWNSEILSKLLKQIVVQRVSKKIKRKQLGLLGITTATPQALTPFKPVTPSGLAIEEVKDIISLPHYDPKAFTKHVDPASVEIPDSVLGTLSLYVSRIADLYRNNPFHNFEHASHVTMSVTKLMSRIVNPLQAEGHTSEQSKVLHDHTFGITSDPLTQFACVLSALIHDVDHPGVSNSVLVNEKDPLAVKYNYKSVAEQNSVDLAWNILMEDTFEDLRSCIFTCQDEFQRFRQILVNIVLATDIMDKELGALRKNRWDIAFNSKGNDLSGNGHHNDDNASCSTGRSDKFANDDDVNRKATIVLEHLIQASDVAHTMQHWHVYRKWNERLFREVYESYLNGRIDKDPSEGWYKGEIGFFDFYVIPLAKKLETCGVFGVSSMEYLGYAEANRREWESKGESIVDDYLKKYQGKTETLD